MDQPIISPIPADILEGELTQERFLRHTTRGGNRLYVVDAHCAPNVMREIGRLREEAFRTAGGGTGLDCDIDSFDTMTPPCRQLVVWDPRERCIIGGYRFIHGKDVATGPDGKPRIATAHLFDFSRQFIDDILPHTIELGRSFVRLDRQATRHPNAIYALDNLWDGLGALTVVNPDVKYLFGKVTMYPNYMTACRDMILFFLRRHFPDPDGLARPITPLEQHYSIDEMESIFPRGTSFRDDYLTLNRLIRARGISIPPLVNAYMNLSPTMRVFGTAVNREFGMVEETGILIKIDDIFDDKKQRYIQSFYEKNN